MLILASVWTPIGDAVGRSEGTLGYDALGEKSSALMLEGVCSQYISISIPLYLSLFSLYHTFSLLLNYHVQT